jgi:GDP-4-dehydro-6-deoxy-D-mannose reductase
MKALITGISGFVGKYLAECLLDKGFEVYGIDRTNSNVKGCKVESCDVLNKEKLAAIINKTRPDFIFHLAALSSVKRSFANAEATKKISIVGTKNLFEAVVSTKISPVILVVSSLQVYGSQDNLPITEDAPLRPESPYAESKVEQEKLCREYFKKGLKIIVSRSFNHTGPGQKAEFVWPSFAKQIAEIEAGKAAEMKVGNLNIERDFSDVRDIAKAYLLAVQKCIPGEIYNICSGKAYNIGKMLEVLKSYSSVEVKVSADTKRMRKVDVPVLYGDNSKFAKATGWKPEIEFEKTLKDVLEYWRKQV